MNDDRGSKKPERVFESSIGVHVVNQLMCAYFIMPFIFIQTHVARISNMEQTLASNEVCLRQCTILLRKRRQRILNFYLLFGTLIVNSRHLAREAIVLVFARN